MGLVIHIGSTKNPRNGKCWYSLDASFGHCCNCVQKEQ